jgi:hypothetical protein
MKSRTANVLYLAWLEVVHNVGQAIAKHPSRGWMFGYGTRTIGSSELEEKNQTRKMLAG